MLVDLEKAGAEYERAVHENQDLHLKLEKARDENKFLSEKLDSAMQMVKDASEAIKLERAIKEHYMRQVAEVSATFNNITVMCAEMVQNLAQGEYRPNGHAAMVKEEDGEPSPSFLHKPFDLKEEFKQLRESNGGALHLRKDLSQED